MKLFKILFAALIAYVPTAWSAVDYNIKYSSNYLMPAYVHFKADVHSIQSMRKLIFRCTTLCLLLVVRKLRANLKW